MIYKQRYYFETIGTVTIYLRSKKQNATELKKIIDGKKQMSNQVKTFAVAR